MKSRIGLTLLVAQLLGLVGCGGEVTSSPVKPQSHRLARDGLSVAVPQGWDGRVLFREPTGRDGVILQVANFVLPENDGLEPPRELPPGEEDRIKAMSDGDVLVMVSEPASWDGRDDAGAGSATPRPPTVAELTPVIGPRVPVGHSLAEGSFCAGTRCVGIEVDFGAARPADELVRQVDDVLASLAVAG